MPAVTETLKHDATRYDPFQIVRLLESADMSRPRVGMSLNPAEDIVSFGQAPSLAFPTSSVSGVVYDGPRPKVLLNNFGLFGSNGPLPLHITEYVDDRVRNHHDTTLRSFCDLLSNRLAGLFYRAWAVNQPAVSYDRGGDDRFSFYVMCLLGLGTDGLSDRDTVPDRAKIYMASRLRQLPSSGESLEQMLGDWFDLPCHVEQMVGEWISIPPERRTRMGESAETCALGKTTVVGGRIWDVQGRFRVHLGPMSLKQYQGLLPGGSGMSELSSWVRLHAGLEYGWDVQLVLREDEVPPVQLGHTGRLGQTTWLGAGGRDRDDLVLGSVA
jgi:type VI secretion system protein ImpH